MTTYKVKYENRQDYPDGFYITISHKNTLIDECRVQTKGRGVDEITNAKLRYLTDFSNAHKEINIKDVLRAFGKVDETMLNLYKSQYKRGGYHGGGRPKGTNRTESLNQRITPQEKEFLLNALESIRNNPDVAKLLQQEKVTAKELEFLIDALDRYRKRHVLIDAMQGGKNE